MNEEGKKNNILFLDEFLNKNFKKLNVYTHFLDMQRKTKKGNGIYKLFIYSLKSHEKMGERKAIKCLSKKNNLPYFMIIDE